MNIAQIEENLQKLTASFSQETFIFDLLLAYGTPKATITRLQQGDLNLYAQTDNTVALKKKLYFVSTDSEVLQSTLDTLKASDKVKKTDPRFIIVTDFDTLIATDTRTDDSLDIPIAELPRHYDFFLPWAGMEKYQQATEATADVKAAERMAKLYDEIRKDNPISTSSIDEQKAEVHNLNVFLSRLLFCFFAEDTGIFEKSIFTASISSHTQPDGSDLHTYLDTLFEAMNTPAEERHTLRNGDAPRPAYLDAFPYVNGGLFRKKHSAPTFSRRSRQMLIESGNLQWQDINPDIFGSMIQAVITPEHRGGMGMHYTSVPNIMKVIEPLFLNELKEEFTAVVQTRHASSQNADKLAEARSTASLQKLLQRIWKIKTFDPACGSGNFLIIAYKELRRLEMQIFKELGTIAFSEINLSNFYGIELDDFAHEVATLSLWLAEHQMNQEFFREFGRTRPALPLQETGNIVQGNACRIDWESVCPKREGDEIFIFGNPPYLGSKLQNEEQKKDIDLVFNKYKVSKVLDYIAVWFYKGAKYIENTKSSCAFVSTNSICQGEQVGILWPLIFNHKVEISFAVTSFKWTNNAKGQAGVTCAIVGVKQHNLQKTKKIYAGNIVSNVESINPYLTAGKSIVINKITKPINSFPEISFGCMPYDNGNLILSRDEKDELISRYPSTKNIIKKLIGSLEFIRGVDRFCLWISDEDLETVQHIPEIERRIQNVKELRLKCKDEAGLRLAERPHQFREFIYTANESIIIPRVSSERREYIPIGFLDSESIISDSAFAIFDAQAWLFSILTSKMHMAWVKTVGGRLKTDYRYSASLCYNTFPFPPISDKQKQELEQCTYRILSEREQHSEKTLAQLYDPDKMPDGLREAHRLNDLAVERCYRSRPFESDEERLEYLFKLYEQMIEEEKERGTLFGGGKKGKKT